MTTYKLIDEDEHTYFFETGKIVGGFFKHMEQIGLCKLCGMEFQLPQRHGPIDLENCVPRGTGSSNEGGVCTECGLRADKTITLMYNDLEYVDICPECMGSHHNIDFYRYKYELLTQVINAWRKAWNELVGKP